MNTGITFKALKRWQVEWNTKNEKALKNSMSDSIKEYDNPKTLVSRDES